MWTERCACRKESHSLEDVDTAAEDDTSGQVKPGADRKGSFQELPEVSSELSGKLLETSPSTAALITIKDTMCNDTWWDGLSHKDP